MCIFSKDSTHVPITFSTSLALGLRQDTFILHTGIVGNLTCSSISAHNPYKQCVYDICTYVLRALECC